MAVDWNMLKKAQKNGVAIRAVLVNGQKREGVVSKIGIRGYFQLYDGENKLISEEVVNHLEVIGVSEILEERRILRCELKGIRDRLNRIFGKD